MDSLTRHRVRIGRVAGVTAVSQPALYANSKEIRMPGRLLLRSFVGLTVAAMLGVLAAAPALAYGSSDQWQAGFAGTFVSKSTGAQGFWGWCAFGGSSGSAAIGTTGTTADCQIENYFGTTSLGQPLNPFHFTVDGTGWVIGTGSHQVPPGVPSFFITSGNLEVSGPGAQLLGVPVGVPFASSLACGPGTTAAELIGTPCDTGIPAVAGHFSFMAPGAKVQIQVTHLS